MPEKVVLQMDQFDGSGPGRSGTTHEYRACPRVSGTPSDGVAASGGDSFLVCADALSVDSVEPDPGGLQYVSHPAAGRQSRPYEPSAQGSGTAICKAGAF